jgi:hypothetical protein
VLTPVLYLAHYWIGSYLGRKQSGQLLNEAEGKL